MSTSSLSTTRYYRLIASAAVLVWASTGHAAEKPIKTSWGTITLRGDETGVYQVRIDAPPADGKLRLPAPFANITRAYYEADQKRLPLLLEINQDASQITLHLGPTPATGGGQGPITLETAEMSGQRADGRIVFSALDATIHGSRAKLETHPGNHRIGYWTNAGEYVSWEYRPTRPGTYAVELTYSGSGVDGTEIEVAVGDAKCKGRLKATGSWYRYTSMPLGTCQIPGPGSLPVTVRCTKKTGGAVMNLKALTLRPASEGTPPVENGDGTLECHARDVTIRGVTLRYEPQPKKNTVGYWVNPKDVAAWDFQIDTPGRFDVEILQGCGKGQGGSRVTLTVAETPLRFTVEDTGHFQNFVPRIVGQVVIDKPGWHHLEVRPETKAAGAVMDLRRVRLIPATAN